MPRVFYDSQVFAEQAKGGVSRYFLNLASAISEDSMWQPAVAFGWHIQDELPGSLATWGYHGRAGPVGRGFRLRREVNRRLMALHRPSADGLTVYHPTWYHLPTIRTWGHLPLVVTVHDLIPEAWPSVTTDTQLRDRAVAFQMARSILCVSGSTLAQFSNLYPRAADKARVSKLGLPVLPRGRPHLAAKRPFLLHVGKRGAYKDFSTVLRGLALLPDLHLVAAGGGPLKAHEQQLISQLRLEGRVLAEPRPSDQRLADLLSATFVLVSASRAEGFGLPPLEAAAQGRPSVLTDIPVYRELHSRWSVFFPPGDPEALAAAVTTIAVNGMALPEPEHIARSFSWSSTAHQTVEAYQAALP